jgi:hypothetical protein
MGAITKWLLDDEQKWLFDYLFAVVLNAVFLALVALVLWPAGKAALTLSLTKAFWVFWVVVIETAVLLVLFRQIFRIDVETRFDAYVISALALSGFVQAGWSAFAALAVRQSAAGAPLWVAAVLYAVGVLSCFVAFQVVSAFYGGSIYRMVNVVLAHVTFVVFAVWPAAGRALYGWFFGLF